MGKCPEGLQIGNNFVNIMKIPALPIALPHKIVYNMCYDNL